MGTWQVPPMAGVGGLTGAQQATAQTAPARRLRSEASTSAGAANLVIYRDAVRYMRTLAQHKSP